MTAIKIVYNKWLEAWYVIIHSNQTPLAGPFPTKRQAEAWAKRLI